MTNATDAAPATGGAAPKKLRGSDGWRSLILVPVVVFTM